MTAAAHPSPHCDLQAIASGFSREDAWEARDANMLACITEPAQAITQALNQKGVRIMPSTTAQPIVFRSCVKVDQPHQQLLEEVADYLELSRITLLSSSISHHPHKRIHIRTDHIDTIDCEGDEVPMTVTKTVTDHYTQIVIYQGGNIIDLPRDFPI